MVVFMSFINRRFLKFYCKDIKNLVKRAKISSFLTICSLLLPIFSPYINKKERLLHPEQRTFYGEIC